MSTGGERRIPSLDGLRAISITLVLISHLAGTRNFPLSAAHGNALGLGAFGVTVFFVISGFLITGLLLNELDRYGRIDLGRFYFRRTLRIFPPYYAFLFCLLIAGAMGSVALNPSDGWRAATYTANYDLDRSWYVGHTWSLSVEEQFYLLWPAVLLLARTRRAILIAAGVVLAAPLIRVAEWELLRQYGDGLGHRFETIADAIAVGCVLAGVRPMLHRTSWYPRILASPAFIVVPLAAFGANTLHDHPLAAFLVGMTVTHVSIALCLDWCVTFHEGRIGRVLNSAPFVYVGLLSYSLYLWQQPFLNRASTSIVAAFPLNILIVAVLAMLSYYLIERPSLALRKTVERAWTGRMTRGAGEINPARLDTSAPHQC